jgi:hypothetical protein
MKTMQQKDPTPKLADAIQLARLRLAKTESRLATAKEQSRLARQHRKAAKQAARAAKKETRLAKARVARAEAALARLETRLAQASRTPGQAPAKQAPNTLSRRHPLKAILLRAPAISKTKKTAARRMKPGPTAGPISEAGNVSVPVSPELETPVEVLPMSEHKPTPEIVKGVEEIFTEETAAPAGLASAVETDSLPESPDAPSTINAQETL